MHVITKLARITNNVLPLIPFAFTSIITIIDIVTTFGGGISLLSFILLLSKLLVPFRVSVQDGKNIRGRRCMLSNLWGSKSRLGTPMFAG